MLASQLNERVTTGQVIAGSVVQLIDYVCHYVHSQKIIFVVNMENFLRECEIIGIPKLIPEPVDLCPDEDASIRQQQFSFRPISEIENAENNSILDVIGVVITVNPLVPILRKNGMETQRRVLKLEDQSGRSVELTMWAEFCNKVISCKKWLIPASFLL